jgi:hypothetical protein
MPPPATREGNRRTYVRNGSEADVAGFVVRNLGVIAYGPEMPMTLLRSRRFIHIDRHSLRVAQALTIIEH